MDIEDRSDLNGVVWNDTAIAAIARFLSWAYFETWNGSGEVLPGEPLG